MACKGICNRHKVEYTDVWGKGGYYKAGAKRCQTCSLFVYWPGIFCPCCGYKLRVHPRSPELRESLGITKKKRY